MSSEKRYFSVVVGLDRIQTGRGVDSVRMVSLKQHCIASATGHDERNSTQSLSHMISDSYGYVIIARISACD
jgi:hypothetical protein